MTKTEVMRTVDGLLLRAGVVVSRPDSKHVVFRLKQDAGMMLNILWSHRRFGHCSEVAVDSSPASLSLWVFERAFSPYGHRVPNPGALHRSGVTARRWRWSSIRTDPFLPFILA